MYYYPFVGKAKGIRRSMFGFCTDRPEAISFKENLSGITDNIEAISVEHNGYNKIIKEEIVTKIKHIVDKYLVISGERRHKVFLDMYYYEGNTWHDVSKKFKIGKSTIYRDIENVRKEILEKFPELNDFL